MRYHILFMPRSERDIEDLPSQIQDRVLARINEMREDLKGDVKRLKEFSPKYRLRVGSYRVLFNVEGKAIVIYRVRHRKESYR